jgi:hypothetical protein
MDADHPRRGETPLSRLGQNLETVRPGSGGAAAGRRRILLAAAGLATILLASACDTGEQVPWASCSSQLQIQIDDAADTGNCAALQALLTAAKTTSHAHEKATGFPQRCPRVLHPGRPGARGLPGRERLTGSRAGGHLQAAA